MNAQVLAILANTMGEVRMRGRYADTSPGANRAAGSWSMDGAEFVLSEDIPQGGTAVDGTVRGVNPVVGGSLAHPHFIGQLCEEVALPSLQEAAEELRGWQRDLRRLAGTCRSLWASRSRFVRCGLKELTLLRRRETALHREQREYAESELRIIALGRMQEAARCVPRAVFLRLARSIAAEDYEEAEEEEELDDDPELDDDL